MIASVTVAGPSTLTIRWASGGAPATVDLAGWIDRGGVLLTPLADPSVFSQAAIGAHGGNVTWDDDEGDLAIDSAYLELLADA